MKQCPACRSQYTDDTLQFCLQDGTPLLPVPADAETETVVSPRSTTPQARDSLHETAVVPPAPRQQRTGLVVFVTALATMLLLGVIGVGYLIVSRGNRQEAVRANVNVTSGNAANTNARPSVSPTGTATPASNSQNVNVAPSPDPEVVSREITKAIAGWESDTESMDMDGLMNRYASTVDYYRNGVASRSAVKQDKDRAFSMYDNVELAISNIRISPGRTGDTAVAEFDKAWVFDGEGHSEGKVRSRLSLKKTGGQWLITGEQDIKVY